MVWIHILSKSVSVLLFWTFKIAPPAKGLPLVCFSVSEVFPKVINLYSLSSIVASQNNNVKINLYLYLVLILSN